MNVTREVFTSLYIYGITKDGGVRIYSQIVRLVMYAWVHLFKSKLILYFNAIFVLIMNLHFCIYFINSVMKLNKALSLFNLSAHL